MYQWEGPKAYHSINNPASGKVMQKAGMKYEGRMRQKYKSHLGFEDSNLYAILRKDIDHNII
jgi:RimJ/RimL family protein N-acetyltransferase